MTGWALLFRGLAAEKAEVEKRVLYEAELLAASYAEKLTRDIVNIDQTAIHVRYDWKISGGRLDLEDAKSEGLFPPNTIFYVAVINQDGILQTGTIPNPDNFYMGDREYFQAQEYSDKDELYIGELAVGKNSKRNSIFFSRRLTNPDGGFGGIVLVSIAPDYLVSGYDDLALGPSGLRAVIRDDDRIMALQIGDKVIPSQGQTVSPVLKLSSSRHGGGAALLEQKWFSDGRSRYVGWHNVEGHGLKAFVGLDQQRVLASYESRRNAAIRQAWLATLALAAFVLTATVLSLRLAWRKNQLETARKTYRTATEGGSEGFYICRPVRSAGGKTSDFMMIDCNERGAQLFRRRRQELIGKTISMLYAGANPNRFLTALGQAVNQGMYEDEIKVSEGSPVAAHWVHFKAVLSDGDLAVTLGDISDTKAHVAELERRSNEDTLTGLPNRHWVGNYLPRAIEYASANEVMLAVLFIDLDGFKAVNDTMGHAAGDEVLRMAGRRLKDAVRPYDDVARLGGDEFVVILEEIHQKDDAAHIAHRIMKAFEDEFKVGTSAHPIGTSIGISVFPSDGRDAQTLLQHADIAMYSVKTSGKRDYQFFDQRYYASLRARLEREAELRHGIFQHQFIVYYQPRIDVVTGKTISMEALVRWAHPLKGMLEPGEFIPLAEETGLINSLGELVINMVCAQLAFWSERGQALVPVSVNVSSRQFNETNVAKIIMSAVTRYKVDPNLIEIELTESSMMGDTEEISSSLTAIQQMGIKLLVDDFGTGYSSLSQLQRLDFDVLKVDRAFTREVDRSEEGKIFFRAIVTMAHALGMRVVAEGVETERQVQALAALECDELQGYYISAPVPASSIPGFIRQRGRI